MTTEATPSAAPLPAAAAGNMKPPTRLSIAGRELGRAAIAVIIAMIATLLIVFFVSKSPVEALMTRPLKRETD